MCGRVDPSAYHATYPTGITLTASNNHNSRSTGSPMAYSDCPQVEVLTRRLVSAYREMSDSEIESGTVVNDLHIAIMEHKTKCPLCKRMMFKKATSIGGSVRVA